MVGHSMPVEDIFSKFLENGGCDIVRDIVERGMQALIELEAAMKVGAGKYERSADRNTRRNGTRDRELETRVGTIHLQVPKFRTGSFFPSVLQARRRSEQALMSVIQDAYVHGVSTRKVDDIIQAMGLDGVSKSEVSRICKSLERDVNDFRDRPLDSRDLAIACRILTRGKRTLYGKEFKEGDVRLTVESGKTVREVAQELGISDVTLAKWRRASGVSTLAAMRINCAKPRRNQVTGLNLGEARPR